jgi:hypothetical protein
MEEQLDENTLNDFKDLAKQINVLNEKAYYIYLTLVDELIASKRIIKNEIEHLLDRILDIASTEKGLLIYKRLCSYYWGIDKEATVFYINAYRELWDEESLKKQ